MRIGWFGNAGPLLPQRRERQALLLVVLLATSGCASFEIGSKGLSKASRFGLGGQRPAVRREVPLRVARPEAPVDYDFLVAEFAQHRGDLEGARAAYQRAAEKSPNESSIRARLARLAWQLEDLEAALREAEIAYQLDPSSIPIRLFLGSLYRLERDFEGLDRVLRNDAGEPLDADSAFSLFQAAFEREDLEEAEDLARQLRALEPDQLRGTLALTNVHAEREEYAQAERTIREALVDFPDHFLLFMRLAQVKRSAGDKAGEIALYREVLEGHPSHYGILQRLAQAQIESEAIDDGVATLERIVEDYPDDQRALRRLASLEFSRGRPADAAQYLERVLAQNPGQPDVAFALGQIRAEEEAWDLARAAFERIEPNEAIFPDARIQIAAIHQAQERFGEALIEIDRVRAVRDHRPLDFQSAALRIKLGDFDGGVDLLESLLDGSAEDLEVLYQLGVYHGSNHLFDESISYMRRVLKLDENHANALNYIGYSLAERGEDLEEAESMIRRALEILPEDGYITDSLGWVYYKMAVLAMEDARQDDALRFLERAQSSLLEAMKLTGGDAVVSEHLGDVLLLRGDKPAALGYYEEAVRLERREEEQPMLLEKLDQLRQDLGAESGATDSDDLLETSGEAP